jgi:type IV secretory pathway ATPase VirB11/archaellum biosynthesis ATPase
LTLFLGNVVPNGTAGDFCLSPESHGDSLTLMAQRVAHRNANARANFREQFDQLAFRSLNTIPNKHDANNCVKRLNNIRVQHLSERMLP